MSTGLNLLFRGLEEKLLPKKIVVNVNLDERGIPIPETSSFTLNPDLEAINLPDDYKPAFLSRMEVIELEGTVWKRERSSVYYLDGRIQQEMSYHRVNNLYEEELLRQGMDPSEAKKFGDFL